MSKLRIIITDGLILFAVSTVLVVVADMAFSQLKGKTPKDDPIVTAITQADTAVLTSLAKVGPTMTGKTDQHGRTALMRAAYANLDNTTRLTEIDDKRAAMIPLLLTNGAPLDAKDNDGWTALMWAAWSGLPKVATELLKNGADQAPADPQGNTAIALAARRGHVEVVRILAGTTASQTVIDQAKAGMAEYPDKQSAYKEIISLMSPK